MAEPLWTSDEILAATGGSLSGSSFAASGVSIDTRTLEPGDLFVALAGVRDGHEFAQTALDRGAAGVLATQPVSAPAVMVPLAVMKARPLWTSSAPVTSAAALGILLSMGTMAMARGPRDAPGSVAAAVCALN